MHQGALLYRPSKQQPTCATANQPALRRRAQALRIALRQQPLPRLLSPALAQTVLLRCALHGPQMWLQRYCTHTSYASLASGLSVSRTDPAAPTRSAPSLTPGRAASQAPAEHDGRPCIRKCCLASDAPANLTGCAQQPSNHTPVSSSELRTPAATRGYCQAWAMLCARLGARGQHGCVVVRLPRACRAAGQEACRRRQQQQRAGAHAQPAPPAHV